VFVEESVSGNARQARRFAAERGRDALDGGVVLLLEGRDARVGLRAVGLRASFGVQKRHSPVARGRNHSMPS
jgi:hypothetical protein